MSDENDLIRSSLHLPQATQTEGSKHTDIQNLRGHAREKNDNSLLNPVEEPFEKNMAIIQELRSQLASGDV